MNTSEIEGLIDKDLMRAADERVAATSARRAKANADMEKAAREHAAALTASEKAVTGESNADPLAAENTLTAAATALNVAIKVRDAAEAAHVRASNSTNNQRGKAHIPVFVEAARRRVAATVKADQARAMLHDADAEYQAALELQRAAVQRGVPNIGYHAYNLPPLPSEAAESKYWADVGVDLKAGTIPWEPAE